MWGGGGGREGGGIESETFICVVCEEGELELRSQCNTVMDEAVTPHVNRTQRSNDVFVFLFVAGQGHEKSHSMSSSSLCPSSVGSLALEASSIRHALVIGYYETVDKINLTSTGPGSGPLEH